MAITVEINSADQTDQISWGRRDVEVDNRLFSEPNMFYFKIKYTDNKSYIPAGGDSVVVKDGTDKVFSGEIIDTEELIDGDLLVWEAECKSDIHTLDNKVVDETYTNTSVENIIKDIISNYASSFDATNVVASTTIDEITFSGTPVSKCIDKLADIVGYPWWIRPEKEIQFYSSGSALAAFDLKDDNNTYEWNTLKLGWDYSQIKNKVIVRSSGLSSDEIVEDSTSQSAYGVKEVVLKDDDITTSSQAQQRGQAVIDNYKDPIQRGSFETNKSGLKAGHKINLQSSKRAETDKDYLITNVRMIARTPTDFKYVVEIKSQDEAGSEFNREKGLVENIVDQEVTKNQKSGVQSPTSGNANETLRHNGSGWAATDVLVNDGTNIGIGQTSPSYKLDVSGDARFTQPIEVGTPTIDAHAATKSYVDSAITNHWTLSGDDIYNDNAGNVGINETSPSYQLDVSGTGRFTQPVIVGTPTTTNHAATKSYVDSAVFDGFLPINTGTPGDASNYKGYLYFDDDTGVETLVFSDGSGWFKVTANSY